MHSDEERLTDKTDQPDAEDLGTVENKSTDDDAFATYEALFSEHCEMYLGPTSMVLRNNHSDHSEDIKVNVHLYPASDERPFLTLVSCGMGLRKMNVDDQNLELRTSTGEITGGEDTAELGNFARAELLLYLPEDWDFGGPDGYTPFHVLFSLARYPQRNSTWLGVGHTVPNGNDFNPLFEGSLLAASYLLPALLEEDEFYHFDLTDGAHLHFLWVQPITVAERHLKRIEGSHALNKKLAETDTFLLDIDRKCTVLTESRTERRARERAQRRRRRASRTTPWTHMVCTECYGTFLDVLTELSEDNDDDDDYDS